MKTRLGPSRRRVVLKTRFDLPGVQIDILRALKSHGLLQKHVVHKVVFFSVQVLKFFCNLCSSYHKNFPSKLSPTSSETISRDKCTQMQHI